ncbi:hypothetical protein D3C87_1713860 [compost metagenome]
MIKFPAPKVPAPQFKGATRSKAQRRASELRKKAFLAKAARGGLAAATAALEAPINSHDGVLADGATIDLKTSDLGLIHREASEVNAKQAALQEALMTGGPVPDDLLPKA